MVSHQISHDFGRGNEVISRACVLRVFHERVVEWAANVIAAWVVLSAMQPVGAGGWRCAPGRGAPPATRWRLRRCARPGTDTRRQKGHGTLAAEARRRRLGVRCRVLSAPRPGHAPSTAGVLLAREAPRRDMYIQPVTRVPGNLRPGNLAHLAFFYYMA